MSLLRRHLHEDNRRSWNAATRAHDSHKAGQAEYLRGGGSTLFAEEIELVGEVRGQRLPHLFCNAGPDPLAFPAPCALSPGVHIPARATRCPTRPPPGSGIAATFVREDVYDFLAEAAAQAWKWDVVLLSYGAVFWLSDLPGFTAAVARVLAPGGRLVILEFHPFAARFEDDMTTRLRYFWHGEPYTASGVSDYVATSGTGLVPWGPSPGVENFQNPHQDHYFMWNLGEILGAVLGAGLRMTTYREWDHANGCKLFPGLVESSPGSRRFVAPEGTPDLPLMMGLVAVKEG